MITVKKPSQKGFVLISALVLFQPVACLIVATVFTAHHARSAVSEMNTLSTAIELFKMDVGRYPTETEGLQALIKQPGEKNWEGPYLHLPKIPLDPWGMPYVYHTRINSAGETEFLIVSYGPKRKPGPGNIGSNNINPATWLTVKPAGR